MAFELQNEKYILYRNVHEQVQQTAATPQKGPDCSSVPPSCWVSMNTDQW